MDWHLLWSIMDYRKLQKGKLIMNETLKTLISRRSIRAYKTKQVLDEILDQILKAGIYATTVM